MKNKRMKNEEYDDDNDLNDLSCFCCISGAIETNRDELMIGWLVSIGK